MAESFITELDHLVVPIRTGKRHEDERLSQVRRDHRRLMDVVTSFGNKVGGMIDTQRADFMTAYEHHIIDVQRELQSLREKVAVIESDATLKAKLDSLDANQKKFKEEALGLDAETLDLRKKLRKLVGILRSVEKERDWYLSKLRAAKKRFNYLLEERSKIGGEGLDTSSLYSNSNDSQYTIMIQRTAGTTIGDIQARLQGVYGVTREQALLQTLPHISSGAVGGVSMQQHQKQQQQQQQQTAATTARATGRSTSPKRTYRTAEDRAALGELVALKARQEAIRDFVAQCASSCDKGPWARIPRRPISELLAVCEEIASHPDDEATEQERLLLAFELAAVPEVYNAISDFLAGGGNNNNGEGDNNQGTRGMQWPALAAGENAFHVENHGFFADADGPENAEDQIPVDETAFQEDDADAGRGYSDDVAGDSLLDSDLTEYLARLKRDRLQSDRNAEIDEFMAFD